MENCILVAASNIRLLSTSTLKAGSEIPSFPSDYKAAILFLTIGAWKKDVVNHRFLPILQVDTKGAALIIRTTWRSGVNSLARKRVKPSRVLQTLAAPDSRTGCYGCHISACAIRKRCRYLKTDKQRLCYKARRRCITY
ncbi:hypothetical protein T4B_3129 [Trichinella pseudospiralis]|uniref:Uncharacterized protein n=1 Tax=Trichinella pseudospiralis TaxID=6337 RepID=A0A0V1J5S1_TRIPS|nr:hypothetical protein T4B_3129 [Trichinella pseudospiralis]KRZ30300.1 hypothetical protein T4C_583 [Trichinella pseudospiralis]